MSPVRALEASRCHAMRRATRVMEARCRRSTVNAAATPTCERWEIDGCPPRRLPRARKTRNKARCRGNSRFSALSRRAF